MKKHKKHVKKACQVKGCDVETYDEDMRFIVLKTMDFYICPDCCDDLAPEDEDGDRYYKHLDIASGDVVAYQVWDYSCGCDMCEGGTTV